MVGLSGAIDECCCGVGLMVKGCRRSEEVGDGFRMFGDARLGGQL